MQTDSRARIQQERVRQVKDEGYTLARDAEYVNGELIAAGDCYFHRGMYPDMEGVPVTWPWPADTFKPKDPESNFVRAGALALAEKERLLAVQDGEAVDDLWQQQYHASLKLFDGCVEQLDKITVRNRQTELFPDQGKNTTSFVDNMRLPVHRWFRYSAGFSAQWVESIVSEGARVLDPFAGSGTTMVAAQASGAEAFGIDSQPFVSRVARAKLDWTADTKEFRHRANALVQNHEPSQLPSNRPALLDKCYRLDALADLVGLRDQVVAEPTNDPISRLLWLAFVAIIRPTSHVGTAQWQYVLPNKRKRSTLGVLEAFGLQVQRMAEDMDTMQRRHPNPPRATFVEGDTRKPGLVPDGWASHVVCSPPYANNYDYADATRLEQTVLGEVSSWGDLKPMRDVLVRSCSQAMARYDPAEALTDPILEPIIDELRPVFAELDAIRHEHGGKKAYHTMVLAYFHDLAYVWRAVRQASDVGVTAVWVVGDSAPYGVYVPVERWLGELAIAEGFKDWSFDKVRDRNVKWKNRKHDVPLHEGRLWVRG